MYMNIIELSVYIYYFFVLSWTFELIVHINSFACLDVAGNSYNIQLTCLFPLHSVVPSLGLGLSLDPNEKQTAIKG